MVDNMKTFDVNGVHYEVRIEPEYIPVRGNACVSGDDAADKEIEDEILQRLDRGDIEAWCCLVVTATFEKFKGAATLGCCSFADEKQAEHAALEEFGLHREAFDDLLRVMEQATERAIKAQDALIKLKGAAP